MVNQEDQTPAVASFPGMDPTEVFQFYFRRHWSRLAKYFGFITFWMLVFAALVFTSGVMTNDDDFTRRMLTVILSFFFLLPHFVFLLKVYKHFLCVVIVTDKKVHQFKRTLVAVDNHQSVDTWVLQDIDKIQRGIVQNMLGFGSMRLEAQNSRLVIHFVPHIDQIYNVIVSLRELARQRMMPGQIIPEEKDLPVQPT